MRYSIALFFMICCSMNIFANEVTIKHVELIKMGSDWKINTTLEHNDTGWDHYADAWRVVTDSGKQLGERILFHPHENEQPFTRSIQRLKVPKTISVIFIEAHDKVHGWSKDKVKVDLSTTKGDRYNVKK